MSHAASDLTSSVFIHSFWRSGSTALFSALRTAPGLMCFYEPLHEGLAHLTSRKTRTLDTSIIHAMGHAGLDSPYFAEYDPLIRRGRGVGGFPAQLSYGDFFQMTPESEQQLRRYFLVLAHHARARGKVPVFCLNRSWGRMESFKRIAPDALHVFSLREAQLTSRSILLKKSYFCARLLRAFDLAQPAVIQATYPDLASCWSKRLRPDRFFKQVARSLDDTELAPLVHFAHSLSLLNGFAHADYVVDLSQQAPFQDDRLALTKALADTLGAAQATQLERSLTLLADYNPHATEAMTGGQPVSLAATPLPNRFFLHGLIRQPLGTLFGAGQRHREKLSARTQQDWDALVEAWYPEMALRSQDAPVAAD